VNDEIPIAIQQKIFHFTTNTNTTTAAAAAVAPLSYHNPPRPFKSPESTLDPLSHRNDNTGAEEALQYSRRCHVGAMRWWGG